jgi:hypothetical protein
MSEEAGFPVEWPDCCPPADAVAAGGLYYRLVFNSPPIPLDFQTNFEANTFPKRPPCLRCALSVFSDFNDADFNRRLYPTLANSLIAMGNLNSDHGRTKNTRGRLPSHTSWWAFAGIERHSTFEVV